MAQMPALFISHGSPMLALEEAPTTVFLRQLSSQLPTPKAIIVASAHWETEPLSITGSAQPRTIHDFQGFPKALYALRYPAAGNPELAKRLQSLFKTAGIESRIDSEYGLDHGAWNPLLLMYPHADIPVIEISVQPHRDARWHYRIGQALATLKQEDILIIGTGNLTHNLREAFLGQHTTTPPWVSEFATWVDERLASGDIESLLDWQTIAPHAKRNHPSPEHFLPFFIALGAASTPLHAKRLHNEVAMGVLAMDAYVF